MMKKLTIQELEGIMKSMLTGAEKINEDIVGMEYHDKNTLEEPRKRLHREIAIPMLDEGMNEMRKECQDIIDELKQNNETEIEMPDDEYAEMMSIAKKVKLYQQLTGGMMDMMNGKIDKNELGNNLVDALKSEMYK